MPMNTADKHEKMLQIQKEMIKRIGAVVKYENTAMLMCASDHRFKEAIDELSKAKALLEHVCLDVRELKRLHGQGDSEEGTTPVE